MRKSRQVVLIALMMLCILPGLGYAADALFDATAATELVDKGVASLKGGNYNAAIEALEKAAAIDPQAQTFYCLGYAYYMKSKKGNGEGRTRAMENFSKAYELDPGFTPVKIRTN